jgi:hypothetical protein
MKQISGLTCGIQDSPEYTFTQPMPGPSYPSNPSLASPSMTAQNQANAWPSSLQTGPVEDVTEPEVFKAGGRARGKIKGTYGDVEELDKSEPPR